MAVGWGVVVAEGPFPPQAAITKLSPTTVRNMVADCLLIEAPYESEKERGWETWTEGHCLYPSLPSTRRPQPLQRAILSL